MTKDYQTDELDAAIPLPASVSVAMEDIAAKSARRAARHGCEYVAGGDGHADGRVGGCDLWPEGQAPA